MDGRPILPPPHPPRISNWSISKLQKNKKLLKITRSQGQFDVLVSLALFLLRGLSIDIGPAGAKSTQTNYLAATDSRTIERVNPAPLWNRPC